VHWKNGNAMIVRTANGRTKQWAIGGGGLSKSERRAQDTGRGVVEAATRRAPEERGRPQRRQTQSQRPETWQLAGKDGVAGCW
jgi:hypothetical protein